MQSKLAIGLLALALLAMLLKGFAGCESNTSNQQPPLPTPAANPFPEAAVPTFNEDSAFFFIQKQVGFGPRVPNTAAHKKCANWLSNEFKRYGLSVIEQNFTAKHFKGEVFNCTNIIAQYKPAVSKRILLAAHWDSRFMADKDTKNRNQPIDGADDGASGVSVLLEIARLLAQMPPDIGVDLICFDAEDSGDDGGESETWCLGSQYWSKNLHRPNYQPYYAILLDMVGAKGARFMKEGVSMQVAPAVVDKIWTLAASLGYSQYFVNSNGPGITDDHVFVIRNARIPMIDVISIPNEGEKLFGDYHHTHQDNIAIIDKEVLKATGQVMAAVIWRTPN